MLTSFLRTSAKDLSALGRGPEMEMKMNWRRFVTVLAIVLCCIGSTTALAQTTTPTPSPSPTPTEAGPGFDALAKLADLIEVLTALASLGGGFGGGGGTPDPTAPVLCELSQRGMVSLGEGPTFLPGDIANLQELPIPMPLTIETGVEPRRDAQGNVDIDRRCTFPGVRIASMTPNPPINPLGIFNPNGDARVDILYRIQAFDTVMRGGCRPRSLSEIPVQINVMTREEAECRAFTVLNYRFNEQVAQPMDLMMPPLENFNEQSQVVTYSIALVDQQLLGFLLTILCGGTDPVICLSGSKFPGLF